MNRVVSITEIEAAMDRLSEIIVAIGKDGHKLLPIYKRLESELAKLKEQDTDMSAIFARAAGLKARKEEQSSVVHLSSIRENRQSRI